MRRYDPNPALSAFTVVIGAAVGIALAVVLGLGGLGVALLAVSGILVAGLVASSLGLVGTPSGGERPGEDLPPEYHDY